MMIDLENWLLKLRECNGILSCSVKQEIAMESLSYTKAIGGKKLRSIAAYAPHAGYSADDFNAFFEQVHVAILGACKDGRQTILGGDFNLQLQVGNRVDQIDALANAFGLTIANDDEHHSPAAETWTFCSSMGVKRRMDFILCSSSLPLAASHPSCLLDLGSDHRAVYARFQIGKVCWNKVGSSRRTKRGWTPELDGTGGPTSHHRILSRSLQTPPADLNSLESVCKYAVSKTSRKCTTSLQTHCNNSFTMIISNHCWLNGGQQHADIEGRKYQKQFGKKFGENFGDKELNALNLCWRSLLHWIVCKLLSECLFNQKVPFVKHKNLMQKNLLISLVTSLRRTPISTPMSSEHYWKKRRLARCRTFHDFGVTSSFEGNETEQMRWYQWFGGWMFCLRQLGFAQMSLGCVQ